MPVPLAFLFFSPFTALLTGLAAVSIPVLIHLFSRRRFRIVTWAAMRFLLAAQRLRESSDGSRSLKLRRASHRRA